MAKTIMQQVITNYAGQFSSVLTMPQKVALSAKKYDSPYLKLDQFTTRVIEELASQLGARDMPLDEEMVAHLADYESLGEQTEQKRAEIQSELPLTLQSVIGCEVVKAAHSIWAELNFDHAFLHCERQQTMFLPFAAIGYEAAMKFYIIVKPVLMEFGLVIHGFDAFYNEAVKELAVAFQPFTRKEFFKWLKTPALAEYYSTDVGKKLVEEINDKPLLAQILAAESPCPFEK